MNFMCNVGDTVWRAETDYTGEVELGGYIFVAQNDECVICSPDPYGYDDTISQYLIEESAGDMGVSVYVFPIDEVYLTREEAEANPAE
jgi:hypothetical protein